MKSNLKRTLAVTLCLLMTTAALAGCTSTSTSTNTSTGTTAPSASEAPGAEPEKASFKFFSLNVNREAGFGLVEQTLIDQYMEENPNVKITVETLENETYKTKLKSYIAGDELPDLFYVWDTPTWFDPLVKAGQVKALDSAFFDDQGFNQAAMPGCTYDGKIYGTPNMSEFYYVYYNKKIFADNGIEVPKTYEDLLAITKKLRDKGIQPCSMNGKEIWCANVLVYNMLVQIGGGEAVDAISDLVVSRNTKFADLEPYKQANIRFTELIDSGFFHDNWLNADYSEMFNLFAQGQSPMMFMSTGLAGIEAMPDLAADVKDNIGVFPFPAKTGDIGDSYYMKAIFITCYSLSKNAPKAAEDFLYWFMDKSNYAKTCWQKAGALPAQDITSFISPEDTNSVKGEILNIQNSIKVAAGQSFYELNTASFRSESQDLMHRYWSKMISLDDYLKGLDESADRGAAEMKAQN